MEYKYVQMQGDYCKFEDIKQFDTSYRKIRMEHFAKLSNDFSRWKTMTANNEYFQNSSKFPYIEHVHPEEEQHLTYQASSAFCVDLIILPLDILAVQNIHTTCL